MGTTLIFNGTIIGERAILPSGYLLIRDARIASMGSDWSDVEAEQRIDAKGMRVCPGLIDMHTHGIIDVSFMESDVPAMIRGLSHYAAFGVTRVVGSTLANPYDAIIAQIGRMRSVMEDRVYGAILHGAHLEGPWLSKRCRGGHDLRYLCNPEKRDVNRILEQVGDVIKTVTFAPELPGAVWLAEQLAARGILPALGHSEAGYEEARKAIAAGARHVTHMYDAVLGYKENPDEALVMMPGMETAVLMEDDVSIELIGCPVHVPKPFFSFINKVKPEKKKMIVTDSLVGTGMPDGSVLTYKDGATVYVSQGVLRMRSDDPDTNGHLTGSAVTLNVGFRRLRQYTGLPFDEAIRWVSLNPATALGIERETGSLKVGKLADIAIMDDECSVARTFVQGRQVHPAE
jgi:N-acetylglucosamine-6-phosphate deacetylase